MAQSKRKPRIRVVLLVLLWVWVACVAVVVDLFLNVEEFDSVRPQAEIYRATRYAAHKMVGEPYREDDFREELPPAPPSRRTPPPPNPAFEVLRAELAAVEKYKKEGNRDGLVAKVRQAPDPRVRMAALRALTEAFRAKARETLLETVHDAGEDEQVRAQAARFVGWTGADALAEVDALLNSSLPEPIRAGALWGLAKIDNADAVHRALTWAKQPSPVMGDAADLAIGEMSSAAAVPQLVQSLGDGSRRVETRLAITRALAASKDKAALEPLAELLANQNADSRLRAAAVGALGRMGHREALRFVEPFRDDASPKVAHEARLATARLSRLRA
ncbi:MAG: HEAT repeat domain-containing protein, partial [Planctomycetota bacterium]